jgi:hypothetical protein
MQFLLLPVSHRLSCRVPRKEAREKEEKPAREKVPMNSPFEKGARGIFRYWLDF